MEFNITPVVPEDMPGLLELIRELAQFERLEHELQATEETLRNSFFGPQPAAGAFLARCGDDLAGYAIYFFTFSSFIGRPGIWLDDVYVRPQFRGQRLGRALFRAVARVGVERNCGRFEWTALDWNEKALEFYRKIGAQTMDQWVLLRLDAAGLQKLARAESLD
jgi:GNAT superfamily N-acetyltransferase